MLVLGLLVLVAQVNGDDGETSRKVLGSSVVTSVSVIMDTGNGSKIYADAVGKPVLKPQTASDLASPINLLNPDRYEFYTFDDSGDLVKRLMTLEEIKDIVATGDDDFNNDSLSLPEKRVNDVVNNVQNVLKEEIKMHKNPDKKPQLDTPDVSETWSMILPAVFGNSGADIKPEQKPIQHLTPETIIFEPTVFQTQQTTPKTDLEMIKNDIIFTTKTITQTTPKSSTVDLETLNNVEHTTPDTELSSTPTTPELFTNDLEAPKNNILRTTTQTTLNTELEMTKNNIFAYSTTPELPTSDMEASKNNIMSTTTIVPTTTTLENESTLPTLLQVLNEYSNLLKEAPETATTTTQTADVTSTIFTDLPKGGATLSTITTPDDLSTLSSEYFTTLNKAPTSTTTEPQTTTILDKFLINSTNIYEINSELFEVGSTSTTEVPTTQQPVVEAVEKLLIEATDLPETDAPMVLLEGVTVAEMIENTTNKTMNEVLSETATFASNLISRIGETSTSRVIDETTTTTTTWSTPHIINITIIRNDAKPAKADLSLEMEYDEMVAEIRNNLTMTEPPLTTEDVSRTETPKNNSWTLVSTVLPPRNELSSVDLVPKPLQGFGLEDSTSVQDADIYQFVQLCNELAFGFWKSFASDLNSRSIIVSPFAATSLLAMVFLGARGSTSGEMNEILKLDDMVSFNPHLIFKNVSESIEIGGDSGIATSAIVRELFSDRSKGKLLGFYKERVRQFYDGHVEETSFKEIGDVIRRRTDLLVKKNTNGKVVEFLGEAGIKPKPPLVGISASILQTDCSAASTEGRDKELYFVVSPSLRQRRLVPIAAVVYKNGFLAGYDPSLDATAAALGFKDQTISTIFITPGQQGISAPGDGLTRLEKRLLESSFKKGGWSRLLRSLIPRPGLELQIPRFQHRSFINATQALKKMGLRDLFDSNKADLKGLNGVAHELYLSEVLQVNEFATCGEGRIGERHYREVWPESMERKNRMVEWEEPRDYQRAFDDPLHDESLLALPLPLRPRQARLPENPRLRFDRPFLYIVRHNPSGLILHMGRFHPRLLP